MKNAILVPTDFSENAWIATQYAAKLAEKFNWDIHLLHVYQTFGRLRASQEFNDEVSQHNTASALEEMNKLEIKFQKEFPNLSVSAACMEGNLADTILNVSVDNDVRFIVMGTKGSTGLKSIVIGSNTFEIIQQSPIGVIAVPEYYTDFSLHNIGLLTNFKNDEINLLQNFINRTSPAFNISLLHVNELGKAPDGNNVLFWKEQIIKKTGINSVVYKNYEKINRLDVSEPIPYCIKHLTEVENIDILLVSYTRKSFFKSLFSRSLVKSLSNEITIPIYFLKTL